MVIAIINTMKMWFIGWQLELYINEVNEKYMYLLRNDIWTIERKCQGLKDLEKR